jgi:hypothetical protein
MKRIAVIGHGNLLRVNAAVSVAALENAEPALHITQQAKSEILLCACREIRSCQNDIYCTIAPMPCSWQRKTSDIC